MKIEDKKFYNVVRPLVSLFIKVFYRPTVIGIENIPKEGRVVLAGNHTNNLDPIMLVGVCKRQIHFLAKDELFRSKVKTIIKGMGCIPVNRKIHDKNALDSAISYLNKDLCVGIFPEGTINRTNDVIMPFKIGAVKAAYDTNSLLVPFIITGKYKLFRKKIRLEFLHPLEIKDDLTKENNRFMKIVEEKLKEGGK